MKHYPSDLDMSVLENRQFVNAVHFAARRFVGIRNSGWGFARYQFSLVDDEKIASAIFRRGDFGTGVAQIWLKRDWMSKVHAHHLHELPQLEWRCDPLPSERTHYGCWENGVFERVTSWLVYPVFVLDAGRPYFSDNAWAAPARWSLSGKQKKDGWIAWRNVEGIEGPIAIWAVGATEAKARSKLAAHDEWQRRHDLRKARIEQEKQIAEDMVFIERDADALATISF